MTEMVMLYCRLAQLEAPFFARRARRNRYRALYAAEWEAARRGSPWNDRVWHEAFAQELNSGSSVLDLGCGAGDPVARYLVEHGLRVTGVDSSPEMIALARDRLPEQKWIVADMRQLQLGRRFDGILAWDSYFHLAHEAQRAMFAVFDAHASDNAVLMFNTGPEHANPTARSRLRASDFITRALHRPSTGLCWTSATSK